MSEEKDGCVCPCHKTTGVLVILVGLALLLGALGVLSAHLVSLAWPVLIILIGLKMVLGNICKCCSTCSKG